MPTKPDFPYSLKEMEDRVEGYLQSCKDSKRSPTIPGLCLALDITQARCRALIKAYNALDGDEARQDRKSLQIRHLRILDSARMRICDELEQRTDTMTLFRLKQPEYAGYKDKEDATSREAININVKLDGLHKGHNPGA